MAAVDEAAVAELEGGSGLHRHDPIGGAGGEGPRLPRAQVEVRTPARALGLRRRDSLETKKQTGRGGARCCPSDLHMADCEKPAIRQNKLRTECRTKQS